MYIAEVDEMPKLHQLQHLSRDSTVVNVIKAVAPFWEKFALYLKMERNMIDIWKRDTGQVEGAARELFGHWLDGNGRQPVSWRTLIQALHEAGLPIIAANVEKFLTGHSGETSQHGIFVAPDITKAKRHTIIHNDLLIILRLVHTSVCALASYPKKCTVGVHVLPVFLIGQCLKSSSSHTCTMLNSFRSDMLLLCPSNVLI